MLQYLIQINFGTLMIIAFMLIFISTNQFFDKYVIRMFRYATLTVLVLVVVDSVDYFYDCVAFAAWKRNKEVFDGNSAVD